MNPRPTILPGLCCLALLGIFVCTLLTTDLFGALLVTSAGISLLLLAISSMRARSRLVGIAGLVLFCSAWGISQVAAKHFTTQMIGTELQKENTCEKIAIDPYRSPEYLIALRPGPWSYTGNAWSPFPFVTCIEYGKLNSFGSGLGERLYFVCLPFRHYQVRAIFLWTRD